LYLLYVDYGYHYCIKDFEKRASIQSDSIWNLLLNQITNEYWS